VTITIPLFALRRGKTSGAEFVVFNLMKGLDATGGDLEVAVSDSDYVSPTILDWLADAKVPVHDARAFGAGGSARFAEEVVYGMTTRADRVIFPNYFVPPVKPRIRQSAVFLYDVQHKAYPQFFSAKKRFWLDRVMPLAARFADKVLFISEFERQQAERFYGSAFTKRGRTVHVALDWGRFDISAETPSRLEGFDRPFILSVTQHYPHKRLDLLIKAFGILALRQRDVELVLVGRRAPGLVEDALASLDPAIAARVRFTGYVSDADLGQFYRQSLMFALPSVYEGFGIPAVEALGFGKPALLVDATAVPEVTRGYARYLPVSAGAAEWAGALEEMVISPPVITDAQIQDIRTRYDPVTIANRVRVALDD
jgi:glycosyltransferase involved in cell wall biosynthesis